ncbi:hypothetical protein OJAV_G00066380 [Oryzias javanicus]|uniref:Uncharacterized protein n=1 Tax=Oryzias javanicus TaxID=123683 RepID=A0A3S2N0D5_ORYJA|nr:hypothetical protein OJAV_G00066380 [Oryzias javanicus]
MRSWSLRRGRTGSSRDSVVMERYLSESTMIFTVTEISRPLASASLISNNLVVKDLKKTQPQAIQPEMGR